ncbi:Small-conductance mechanosensitive channel [bacterium HR23]|nr:Small-conductance mechanosensitive channel [bacterium HR23]
MVPAILAQENPALVLREVVLALITFGIAVGIALVVNFFLQRVVSVFTRRTATTLDDRLVSAVRMPLVLFILVVGAYLALLHIDFLGPYQAPIRNATIVLVIFTIASLVNRVVGALVTWYGEEMATRTKTDIDEKLLPILRRVAFAVVWGMALIIALDRLHINISPLVAGLGISGLAVALALQPTLSNFFAGTYILTDGSIRPGDFIQLDSGVMGEVKEIGWRTTKIQTPENNLVIIPNNKLADAVVTNYFHPTKEMNAVVSCGVSYESDLERVEKVALEVAERIQKSHPSAVPTWTPVFRFREFGDSNITFIVVLRAIDRGSTFALVHEFIKALHRRFAQEGIVINYPARTLYFADGKALQVQVREARPVPASQREDPPRG